jgi:AbrB family looped-hinge helix DNA binding protein
MSKEDAMTEATLTSKGQITIPKAVRDTLGLATGDRVEFIGTDKGFVMAPVRRDLNALCGMFKGRRAKPATLDDIKAAIGEMGRK